MYRDGESVPMLSYASPKINRHKLSGQRYLYLGIIILVSIIALLIVVGVHLRNKDDLVVLPSKNREPYLPILPTDSANQTKNGIASSPESDNMAPTQMYQGYNSVTGEGLNPALEGIHKTIGGGWSRVDYYVCTDVTSVFKSLDIGVAASFSMATVFGISAKVKFVSDLRMTAYSVSIVVHSRRTLSTTTTTEQRLKDGILPPKTDDQLRDFVRQHGDSFIGALTLGSEYYAAYVYHCNSSSEQTNFVTDLNSNWNINEQGALSANFTFKLASVNNSTSILRSFNHNVAGISNPKLPKKENEFIDYALSFVGIPVDLPVVISYDTVGYERVLDYNTFLPIVRNRIYFIGDRLKEGLTNDLVTINELKNSVGKIKAIYDFYNYSKDKKIVSVSANIKIDLETIANQVRSYSNDPLVNLTKPLFESLKSGTPQLQYIPGNYGPQGSTLNGFPFDDVDINTHLQRHTRISAVAIGTNRWWTWWPWYAYGVSELTTTYEDRSGIPRVNTHGGGGHAGNTLQLLPDQHVQNIAGKASKEVDWLQVTITDGRLIQGGSNYYGTFFNWNVPAGSIMMGFNGRSDGAWVYQIGMSYATLKPAKWTHHD